MAGVDGHGDRVHRATVVVAGVILDPVADIVGAAVALHGLDAYAVRLPDLRRAEGRPRGRVGVGADSGRGHLGDRHERRDRGEGREGDGGEDERQQQSFEHTLWIKQPPCRPECPLRGRGIRELSILWTPGRVLTGRDSVRKMTAYIYGADHVIWVVGAQKITKDLAEGMQRLEEYVLPLESVRAHEAYGVPGSVIARLLINNKEVIPGRTSIILVKESLGF